MVNISDDEKDSVCDGNYSLLHDKPEDMTLAGIVDEMIRIVIRNPRVLDEYFYMKDSTPGKRYRILKYELISREEKYLKFAKLLENDKSG